MEGSPGVVLVVSAWMLDSTACARMTFGAPRVSISALAELHQQLIERGFRRSSLDDLTIVQEEQDGKPTVASRAASTQHSVRLLALIGKSIFQTIGFLPNYFSLWCSLE